MILPDPCTESALDPDGTPYCAVLDSAYRPTPNDPSGYRLIWTYGKTGGDAIQRMQKFVSMMLKEKQGGRSRDPS